MLEGAQEEEKGGHTNLAWELVAVEDLIGSEEIQLPWPCSNMLTPGSRRADAIRACFMLAGFTSSRFWTVLGGEPHMCSSALSKRRKTRPS